MREPHIDEAIRRILSQPRRNAPGPCPDANELAAFLEARLTPAARARFEEHAADCASCREALALAMRLDSAEESRAAGAVTEPRSFVYSTSPVRLAFGAAVVLIVAVLLIQTTRQSQRPALKSQVAAKQDRSNISGGPAAAMSSKETKTSTANAPAAPADMVAVITSRAPERAPRGQPAPKPQSVMPSGSAGTQIVAETGQAVRPQVQAQMETPKFAYGEAQRADLRQNALPSVENKGLKTEMTANRPEEAKAKADAAALPAGQITQQANVAAPQNISLNQQAAMDQVNVGNAQAAGAAGGRAGAAVLQAADEKKQAELQQKAQASQQVQPVQAAAQGQEKRLQMLRSMVADGKVNRIGLAIEEARVLMSKDPNGTKATKIGQRLFYRTTNYWIDAGCVSHSEAPTREISRGSKDYADVLAKEQDLARLHTSGVPVLLYWNGMNYLIR